ncbi:MAG: S-layer homology domain-containing protein [Oscillospiraceae bacterium]|nr:S-layer homology domain-containing protein [Oscillospiraceae bacterium]
MKRILSMILACCMLMSMLPLSYAESVQTGNKVVYDFEDKFQVTDPATPYSSLTYDTNNNLWEYKANSKGYTNILSTGAVIRAHKSIGEIALIAQNPEKTDNADKAYWIAFEINVPKKGNYSLSVNATPLAYGKSTYIDTYLFNANGVTEVEDGIIPDNKLTSKKFKADTENETLSLGKKELDAGKYYFVFSPASSRSNSSGKLNGSFVYLHNFTLEADIELESASVSLQENILYPGEYTNAKASAKNNIGEDLLLDEVGVEFKSSDESVAIISSSGEIYAVSPGTTEITATVRASTSSKTSAPQVLTVKSVGQAENIPQELSFDFPQGFIYIGQAVAVKIADVNGNYPGDGIKYTYSIQDESIISEKNGTFSAKKIGKTKVDVLAEFGEERREFTFDAVVVGENLLVRHGVDHGQFENSIYMKDGSVSGVTDKTSLWNVTKNGARDNFTYELLKNQLSPTKTAFTNIAKISFEESVTSTLAYNILRLQGRTGYYAPDSTDHNGLVNLDPNKLYELTGYIKSENIDADPVLAKAELYYYTLTGQKATALKNYNNTPWEKKTGAQDWTQFTVPAVWLNWNGYDGITVDPRVEIQMPDEANGDYYIANLHLHEVCFDSVDFRLVGTIENPKTYDTFKTSFRALTNTGNEIISGDTNQTIIAKYSSTNENVARVSEDGIITVVSDGECDILAEVTINNVTKTGRIPVSVSGLEVMFEKVKVTHPETIEVGKNDATEIKCLNTDGTEYSGDDLTIYYESNTPGLATIDQNGIITAKNPGKAVFSITANVGLYNTKTTFEIIIVDNTELASAGVTGAESIEKGFSTKLSAVALHSSGNTADISQCEVEFSLCDEADIAILEVFEDGTVTGISEGTADVQVSVTLNGKTVTSNPYSIEVTGENPKSKSWDFRARPNNSSALDATLEADGWCVNRDKTAPTRVTAALGGNFSAIRCLSSSIQFSAPKADNTIESDLAIDFTVDHSGWYQPVFVGRRVKTGKDANLYIDGEYAGYCNFKSGGNDTDIPATVKLNPIYLEKGTHTLTLRAQTVGYLYPISFSIKWLGDEPLETGVRIIPEKTSFAVGETISFDVVADLSGGMTYKFGNNLDGKLNEVRSFIASVSGEGTATVSGYDITAKKAGKIILSADVKYNEKNYSRETELEISPEGFAIVKLSSDARVMKPDSEGGVITVSALNHLGKEIQLGANDTVVFSTSDETIVTVDESGYMTPAGKGTATISVEVTIDGVAQTGYLNVSVRDGKTRSTYYTEERVLAARENISGYDWAKEEKETAVDTADYYLQYTDALYEMIPSQGIPRSYHVGYNEDPDIRICRYCGANLQQYGSYPWSVNALTRPWKVQCPDCKRLFPSNDFAKLYELGKNEHGEYDVALAHERNEKLRIETNGEVDYLKNTLYPELYNPSSDFYNKDPRTGDTIDGTKWGVDDGLGYDTGRVYPNGTPEVHTYIAAANHLSIWKHPLSKLGKGVVFDAITSFRDAYVYTGNAKYGRAGAILLDRIADLYPDYSVDAFYDASSGVDKYHNSGGNVGKILGAIWDATSFTGEFATAYDAFFPMYDDSQVINYLSEKAVKYSYGEKLIEDENGQMQVTSETVRQNIEKNFLEEVYFAIKTSTIDGNFGMKQDTLSKVAVVYDTEPLTSEMIQFIMQSGENTKGVSCTGGNVFAELMNTVDRDGYGDESSFGYNKGWPRDILETVKTLALYENVSEEYNLIANPKFVKMLSMETGGLVAGMRCINLGDAGGPGQIGISFDSDLFLAALSSVDSWNASEEFKEQQRILYSQILYLNNGNTTKDLHFDIFTKDPESIQKAIDDIIREHGEYELVKSDIRTGFGLAILQDGVDFRGKTPSSNLDITTRALWMYFGGGTTSHKHYDGLQLGIDAFGMNLSPDLGYPADTGAQGGKIRVHWVSGTVSHNTVVVNDMRQVKASSAGNVMHFDDSGEIKVMDVDMPDVYGQYVDTYRRTVVSVDVDDTVSYALDFFRIIGGDEHVYSFHAQSREAETDLDMFSQPVGTYAGADVPYGDDTYSASHDSGYNYLKNVERAQAPGTGNFTVDFDIEKMRKFSFTERDWHLRLTMLNDFELNEVALADGEAPERGENPPTYKYVLARRSGKNMNTLFTTVLEPYIGTSNIKSLERVGVKRADGGAMRSADSVAAVKVTLKNGRVDYVVYSTNNEITYRIDDLFDFCGFVGVYTVSENDSSTSFRSYLLDGTKIGETETESAAIEGIVKNFTREPEFENFIEIKLSNGTDPSEIDTSALCGKLLDIENDGFRNGDYWIKNATIDGDILRLDIGDVTTVRGYVDAFDFSKGYVCNIEEHQKARIALACYDTSAPDFAPVKDTTVSAGSSITIPLNVLSPEGRNIELIGTTIPRGMSIDNEKMELIWKPSSSQVGENHVAITASDGVLTTTVRFTITVYGSTSGGGGGGGATTPTTPSDKTENDKEPEINVGEDIILPPAESDAHFIDLGAHAWAEDAINSLASSGIIRGTSENTFSPGSNITRADFAILLVRAFKLESDNAENFTDVLESDYFARELAIARNNGIVNGVGDNKYAPRNTITRQDMMVIEYRALKSMDKIEKRNDTQVVSYEDFDKVADYAKEAVLTLVGAGIVNGKSDLIAPADYTTRAEVAVLIKRILDYMS